MKTQRETPEFVIIKMLDKIQRSFYYDKVPAIYSDGKEFKFKILEPSAGVGKIYDVLNTYLDNNVMLDIKDDISYDCFELNEEKSKTLTEKGYNLIGRNFLTDSENIEGDYNLVIAAPPFKDNIDLLHIEKMYGLLVNGGQLVSLISPYFMTNNSELQVNFRNFLSDKEYEITMLPDNTFVERGKTVPTGIIKISKFL